MAFFRYTSSTYGTLMSRSRNKSPTCCDLARFSSSCLATLRKKKKSWFYNRLFQGIGPSDERPTIAPPRELWEGAQAAQTRPMKTWRRPGAEDLSHLSSQPYDISRRLFFFFNEALSSSRSPIHSHSPLQFLYRYKNLRGKSPCIFARWIFNRAKLKTRESNFECIAYIYIYVYLFS